MNNLILNKDENKICLRCSHSNMLELSQIQKGPAIVCSKDVTKRTFDENCIYFRDTEDDALTDEEFANLLNDTDVTRKDRTNPQDACGSYKT